MRTLYTLASITVGISAILHGAAVVLGRFSSEVISLIPFLLLYLVFAYWLSRAHRWAAWLTFLVMLVGITGALLGVNGGSSVPNVIFYAIAILDAITAFLLFIVLWKKPQPGIRAEAI